MKKIENNLNYKDSDNDGLSDFEEINVYKTDPNNPDTDGDGLNDCDEVRMGFNPLFSDFFIPNECNNYRPKALRPNRVIFYGFSAIIMKAIVVFAVISLPLSALLSPDYIAQESKKIVYLTNEVRTNLNLPELSENAKLNQAATWKAEDMAVKQYFAHTGPDGKKLSNWLSKASYNFHFGGENLAMGFSNANDVVSAWKKSPSHYKNIIDPDFKDIGVGIANGNYNNAETTFVAQYFGSLMEVKPQEVIEEVKESVTPSSTITKPEVKEVTLAPTTVTTKVKPKTVVAKNTANKNVEIKSDNVLSEKQNIKDIVPGVIQFEGNKTLFTNNNINISVSAPDCKGFSVFVNTVEQINKSDVCGSTEKIYLKEGINTIVLETTYLNNEKNKSQYGIILDSVLPEAINKANTKILMSENFAKELAVSAEIYLSNDVEKATMFMDGKQVDLVKDTTDNTKWTGHTIIENRKNVFKPALSVSLKATDYAGNELTTDVDWTNNIPFKTTIGDQYSFAKAQKHNSIINQLFGFTTTYYQIIFCLAIILLMVNIFVHIRKQRADVIISSFLLIALMGFLIIF